MNQMTKIMSPEEKAKYRRQNGMLPEEAAYMRGDAQPAVTSIPHTTSKYLNSALFRDAFVTMALRRAGHDLPVTYDIPIMSRGIADVNDYDAGTELVEAERGKNPEFAAWLDARKPINLDPERLADAAPGTFGALVHEFLSQSGMELKFTQNYAVSNDVDYLFQMIGHTHDLAHLSAGFGMNMAGEQGVNALCTASIFKYFSPETAHFINITTSFVTSLLIPRVLFNYPAGAPVILEATRWGIESGQKLALPPFMIDYEKYLDWHLDDMAADLGIVRAPGKDWDYSEALCTG